MEPLVLHSTEISLLNPALSLRISSAFATVKNRPFHRDVEPQFKGMPFVYTRRLPDSHPHRVAANRNASSPASGLLLTAHLRNFQTRSVNFSTFDWQPLLFHKGTSRPF